jgi:hypothetical protein
MCWLILNEVFNSFHETRWRLIYWNDTRYIILGIDVFSWLCLFTLLGLDLSIEEGWYHPENDEYRPSVKSNIEGEIETNGGPTG